MATHWVEVAARLDHQHASISQFGELVNSAKANLRKARKVSVADGIGLSKQTSGSGQPQETDPVSHAKCQYQSERGENSAD